jgi:general secretion pathway protein A
MAGPSAILPIPYVMGVIPMNNNYYGMSFNPFDRDLSTKDAFLTLDMKEMKNRLEYLKNNPGIGVFTAGSGQGKTFSLRCFSNSLNPNITKFTYICLSTVTIMEFYRQLCDCLGIDVASKKTAMFRSIQDYFENMSQSKRIHSIVCLDEAQYLNSDILRELKMLTNFSMDSKNCFSLILLGQPILNNILVRQPNEALRQRIIISYNFRGLEESEAMDYIQNRLLLAGASASIINENAMLSAYSSSGGSIRKLNLIMTKALMIGAQNKMQHIDTDIILSAVNEIELI